MELHYSPEKPVKMTGLFCRGPKGSKRMSLSSVYLCWAFGVKASSRFVYWKKLIEVVRRNPSRLVRYLNMLFVGKDMVDLYSEIRKRKA